MRPVLPADLGGTGRPLRDPDHADPDEDD